MKMWSGRFKDAAAEIADEFNSSLPVDKRLYKQDIMGSIAHCTMLSECGIIQKFEADLICTTLTEIFFDIKSGKLQIENAEDIHMFVEATLTKRIGDVGKKLHTARSRNDQVALDMRLYMRESTDEIVKKLKTLIQTIISIAKKNTKTIMPAYTHMQKAQPTTLAHYLMAYSEMFARDIERFLDCRTRINIMPLGSCALTGTTYPINRLRVAELLDFPSITPNSLDAVADRDYILEFLSTCSIFLMHMSRFNEELIYFASDEFGYVSISDAFSTGSSIMPQKKNPDICELIRGKCGKAYGNLMAMLTVMKGLPLSYNKDMQEDKELVFDTEDTVNKILTIFDAMLQEITFNKERLYDGASGGFTAATDCADYLAKKGMPFREAHSVIGQLVIYCIENQLTLEELTLEELKSFSPLFDKDLLTDLKLENMIANRSIPGAPSEKSIQAEIKKLEKFLQKIN